MTGKQDILDRAVEWQLRPEIVEKDYILGWILAAISRHPEAGRLWIFKGGTCLKKCYFETYRFSEDLDFSFLPEAGYTADKVKTILGEIATAAEDLSGIRVPAAEINLKARRDKNGRWSGGVKNPKLGGPSIRMKSKWWAIGANALRNLVFRSMALINASSAPAKSKLAGIRYRLGRNSKTVWGACWGSLIAS